MNVQIFGPNLRSPGETFHVHSAGCRDCRNYGPRGKFGGETTNTPESFDNAQEMVESYYGPQIEESDGHWREYVSDFKLFACLGTWGTDHRG